LIHFLARLSGPSQVLFSLPLAVSDFAGFALFQALASIFFFFACFFSLARFASGRPRFWRDNLPDRQPISTSQIFGRGATRLCLQITQQPESQDFFRLPEFFFFFFSFGDVWLNMILRHNQQHHSGYTFLSSPTTCSERSFPATADSRCFPPASTVSGNRQHGKKNNLLAFFFSPPGVQVHFRSQFEKTCGTFST